MIKDKNGTEIKIGDRVHYKRPEYRRDYNYGNGQIKTITTPARDIIFTVDEFVDSPFVKHGGRDSRMAENRIWISGPELETTLGGSRNAVSPLAVVKVNTMARRIITHHSFK